jgi:hypothetical protein
VIEIEISISVNSKRLHVIQGDQKVSVHLKITGQKSGEQRLFDHPVYVHVFFRMAGYLTYQAILDLSKEQRVEIS